MTPADTGRTVLDLLRAARFAEIVPMFAPNLRALVTPGAVQGGRQAEVDRNGAVTEVGVPVIEPAGPTGTLVKFPVTLERGAGTVVVIVTDTGHLGGIQLAPPRPPGPRSPGSHPSTPVRRPSTSGT